MLCPVLARRRGSPYFPRESGTSVLYGMTTICLNGGKGAVCTWIPWERSLSCAILGLLLLLALPAFLTGCVTQKNRTVRTQPGSGVVEYRLLASESAGGVLRTLCSLEQVSAQVGECPRRVLTSFAENVEQLQIGSVRVRARAQAIRARGDAYFQAWAQTNYLSESQRSRVPEFLPELRESFEKIKMHSGELRETFRPFLDGLRNLRAQLEANPAIIETDDGRKLIRVSRAQGLQVLEKLGALRDELEALRPLLASAPAIFKP